MSDRKDRAGSGKSSPEPSSSQKLSPEKLSLENSALDGSSYVIKFDQTEADQTLRQALEQALEAQNLSFSDLCKRSLQLFFNPPELPQSVATLQQQVQDLQMQMARLEGKEEARQRYALRKLEQQMRELGDRLEMLERKEFLEQQVRQLTDRLARLEIPEQVAIAPPPPASPPSKPRESDPLLDRLAPLLEDF
ncbi:MAG TPA: hypothetical protein V6C84_21390 [Coleofasciculaceae cyanobacterium]|jgi:DNA repair exonuclease SbcCD ATPase subunit